MIVYVYHGPQHIAAPAAIKNTCPFCGAEGFKAPNPCRKCNTSGYSTGTPPGYRRTWRRRGRDHFEPDGEEPGDSLELPDMELSLDDLEEIDLTQDADPYNDPDSDCYTVVNT